jgi:quercetin dioxygenase-like cupin family protein
MPALPRPVVDADHPRRLRLRHPRSENAQQRVLAHRHQPPPGEALAGAAAEREAKVVDDALQPPRTARVGRDDLLPDGPAGEVLSRYRHFLTTERGLVPVTALWYVDCVRPFGRRVSLAGRGVSEALAYFFRNFSMSSCVLAGGYGLLTEKVVEARRMKMTTITSIFSAICPGGIGRAVRSWAIFGVAALALPMSAAVAGDRHVMVSPDEVGWTAGPASIPPGAEVAVLYGNPGKDGLFALRLRLPEGYHLPPHHHPKPEVVTVISGTFHLGMGEKAERDATVPLKAGSFFAFEPGMVHYAFTEEETVIQLNSTGPWGLEYVNPKDDPRQES